MVVGSVGIWGRVSSGFPDHEGLTLSKGFCGDIIRDFDCMGIVVGTYHEYL
jgi:hypothetical protein